MTGQFEIRLSQQERISERENKIHKTLKWIDKRIVGYLSLLVDVVEFYNKERVNEAESLLKIALRVAFFYDFYAETKDRDFLDEANRYKTLLYSQVSAQDKKDLQKIESQIRKLFEYEKQIGKKIKIGIALSDGEIKKHWQMKSSDALFYGRIINIFAIGKNLMPHVYVYTQILDMLLDIREYKQDLKKQELNMLYMRLSQVIPNNRIPVSKLEAIEFAKNVGISNDIKKEISDVASQLCVQKLKDGVISSAIAIKQKEIETELA